MTPNDNNPRRPKTRSITAQEENDVSNSDTPPITPTNKAKHYRKLAPINKDDEQITKPVTKKMKMTTKPKINNQKYIFQYDTKFND
jgi:hypothetical protein